MEEFNNYPNEKNENMPETPNSPINENKEPNLSPDISNPVQNETQNQHKASYKDLYSGNYGSYSSYNEKDRPAQTQPQSYNQNPQFVQNTQPDYAQNNMYNQQPYQSNYQSNNQFNPYQQRQAPPTPPKKNSGGKIIFISLIVIAIIVSSVALVMSMGINKDKENNSTTTTTSSYEEKTESSSGDLVLSETPSTGTVEPTPTGTLTAKQIAQKLSASNVGIIVYDANQSTISEGSGIVMSEDGYIITCAHVISDPQTRIIRVVLNDETEYDAQIIGYDERTDIGILKITPNSPLVAAEFGNSDNLSVGDEVIAIGNPGGMQFFGSISSGLVSAIDRPVDSSIGYTMKTLQHTAAISPGNSGGMLVNMYGQVIGINSAKIASTEFEGIGFAVPMTSAKVIIDDLIEYGYVKNRAKLGISYVPVSQNYQYYMVAYSYGMPTGSIVIETISEDSDIAGKGVQRHDFITAVNGEELTDSSTLPDIIENSKPGDEITLMISRISNDSINTFEVTCKLVEDTGKAVNNTTNDFNDNNNQDQFQPANPFGF